VKYAYVMVRLACQKNFSFELSGTSLINYYTAKTLRTTEKKKTYGVFVSLVFYFFMNLELFEMAFVACEFFIYIYTHAHL
jgi:hypothetical protein